MQPINMVKYPMALELQHPPHKQDKPLEYNYAQGHPSQTADYFQLYNKD